ncbi:MAG: prolyl oligopeptidase family serine peptidase, partial [Deltaproteobacteria bacterium]
DSQTPPTFVVHAIDDYGVLVQNSLFFYAALKQSQVPAELFLYARGGHGFGIYNHTAAVQWVAPAIEWVKKEMR